MARKPVEVVHLLYLRREYARSINAFSARYRLDRPHVTSIDANLNLRRFIDESRLAQTLLGYAPATIGRVPFEVATQDLYHPSIYLDNPKRGGKWGIERHNKALHDYRTKQHGVRTGLGRTSDAGVRMIADFEGVYPNWYSDPVGIQTIGIGHTGPLPAGFTAPLSTQESYDLLAFDLAATYEPPVNHGVRVAISQNRYDALVSFCYNLGAGDGGLADLLPGVNRQDWNVVANQVLEYDHAGGGTLPGLTRRRQAEAALIRRG